MEEPQSAKQSPKIPICAAGEIDCGSSRNHAATRHPTDCTQARTDCCPVTFCVRGDTSKPRQIHIGHEASQIRVTFPRCRGRVHGIIFQKRLPNIDSNATTEEWLEQLKFGSRRVSFETCRHKSDDDTPAYIRVVPSDCSRPIVNFEFFKKRDRHTAPIDDWNLSFEFQAVRRYNSVERSECKRNRQRQTSMFLLGLASPTTQCST